MLSRVAPQQVPSYMKPKPMSQGTPIGGPMGDSWNPGMPRYSSNPNPNARVVRITSGMSDADFANQFSKELNPQKTTATGTGSQQSASPILSTASGSPWPSVGSPPATQSQPNQSSSASGMNVSTSIPTSVPLYSQQQTNAARNNAVAQAFANNSAYSANKMFARPGVSRGAGTSRLTAPTIAQGYVDAADAATSVPFNDALANQQFDIRSQVARENEAQGWAGIGQQMKNFNNQLATQNQSSALALLQALYGGLS